MVLRAWGSIDVDYRSTVDRNGMLNLPKVGSFNVAGVKAADLERHLRAQIGRLYTNFNLSVSLGQLRGLRVAARLQQVEQLVPGLLQARGLEVGGEHLRGEFQHHHQRVAALQGRLFHLLPARAEQGEHGQQPGDAEVDPRASFVPAAAARQQPGMEGRRQ